MDNHATTPVDPRVVEAMLPFFTTAFGNPGSTTHAFGHAAKQAVDAARAQVAAAIGAEPREIVFTGGATESNNLAIRGVAERYAHKGKHLVSVCTEHPSVLEPLQRLGRHGFEITLLPVIQSPDPQAGLIRPEQLAAALRDDTILVSAMAANNEIGAIHPLAEIGRLCRERGVLLHCDATQAVGRVPIAVRQLPVDLMSFTAHKIYGPKGVGALYVRHGPPRVRLEPLVDGGGQEGGLRAGTLNVPGIVGFARALELCVQEMPEEAARLAGLRERLYEGIRAAVAGVTLNGPAIRLGDCPSFCGHHVQHGRKNGTVPFGGFGGEEGEKDREEGDSPVFAETKTGTVPRLSGNLNLSFAGIDGESLLISMPQVALSAGSACTSAHPEPSHVLRALGLSPEAVRGSVRFGLGRFNTAAEVDRVIAAIAAAVTRLRTMV
jgi:cysteine desulfurase